MPKVTTKRRKDEAELEFAPITDKPVEKSAKAAEDARIEALTKQIEALNGDMRSLRETNIALMAAPPQQRQAPVAPKEPVLDLAKLPDPLDDKEGYEKALADRVTKFNRDMRDFDRQVAAADQQSRASTEGRVDALWETFAERFPELADDEDIVGFAATKVVKLAQQKGLDTERYMFGASSQFLDDVAKQVQKLRPADENARKAVEGSDDDDASDAGDEPANRTTGLFGGNEGGNKPTVDRVGKPGDMLRDLNDLQRGSGFF